MKIVECPINDFVCPYFSNGDCIMSRMENGADPHEECDAFFDLDEYYSEDEDEQDSSFAPAADFVNKLTNKMLDNTEDQWYN